MYQDLDAPEGADSFTQGPIDSHGSSNPSSSSGKKNKKSAHEKDEDYPPKTYTQFIREVTMEYYRVRSTDMLRRTWLNGTQAGVALLQADLEREFWAKLAQSEEYMDCMTKYYQSSKWMAQQVTTATTNVTAMFDVVFKKPRGFTLSEEEKKFRSKLQWVQKECGRFSAGKSKVMPWNEQLMKSAMEQHMHAGVVWVPEKAKVVPLSGFDAQGGYGVVRKVRIANMPGIPIHIEFAGKLSKAKTEREKREERSIEALVCPVQHPGVIKFWAIHSDTMEAYTLWWNGDCLRKFLRVNSKASDAISYEEVLKLKTLTMEECERIVAFRRNRAMLAWGLIYVMALVHKAKIIHNDLTPSNILLHFPPDNVQRVYIGVCDWGMACRTVEKKASYFGMPDDMQSDQLRRVKRGVAPELFFVYGPRDDEERNLERMKSQHPYTMEADAFSVGFLAKMIWDNEPNDDLFKSEYALVAFRNKLDCLVQEDPTKRPSLAKVVDLLSSTYNFPIPDSCFRYTL